MDIFVIYEINPIFIFGPILMLWMLAFLFAGFRWKNERPSFWGMTIAGIFAAIGALYAALGHYHASDIGQPTMGWGFATVAMAILAMSMAKLSIWIWREDVEHEKTQKRKNGGKK